MTASSVLTLAASSGEGNISFFHTAFSVCVAFSILFFVVSVALFFVFDIKNIFDMRTGRAEKQKIREMEEENALTGRLINPNAKIEKAKQKAKNKSKNKTPSAFSERLDKLKRNSPSNNIPRPNIPGLDAQQYNQQYNPQSYPQQAYAPQPLVTPSAQPQYTAPQPVPQYSAPAPQPAQPTPLQQPASGDMQTTVLGNDTQTTVLGNEAPQTTVLGGDASQTTVLGNDAPQTTVLGGDASQTTLLSNETPQTTVLSGDSSQTTLLSPEQAAPAPMSAQNVYEEEPPQTSLLSSMGTSMAAMNQPVQNAAGLPQPVHNVAQRGELGQAAGSINFMVGDGETSRLDDKNQSSQQTAKVNFRIVRDIMLIHSAESIN